MQGLLMRSKKGQSTLEYALVIVVIVAAIVVMQGYIKKAVQGGLRGRADDIGEQFSPFVTYGINTEYNRIIREDITSAGKTRTNFEKDTTIRTGTEVINMEADYWPG